MATASYPTSIKVWTPYPVDLESIVYAADVTTLYDEVTAIETQLGTGGVLTSTWAGTFAANTSWSSLRARLLNIEAGVKASVDGRVKTSPSTTDVTSVVTPTENGVVGLIFKAKSGSSADLVQFKNSSNSTIVAVSSAGKLTGVIDCGTIS